MHKTISALDVYLQLAMSEHQQLAMSSNLQVM
jgi:hypothetical protein